MEKDRNKNFAKLSDTKNGTGFAIITVSYNCANTIERTIASVLNQRNADFEYIIIDGSSDDGTCEIIQRYKDSLAYEVSEKDNGIYDAMNKALKHVTKDVVCFLNGDDFFLSEDVLYLISKEFETSKADIVIGRIREKDGEPKQVKISDKTCPYYGVPFPHQATFSKRHLYDELSGFDENYQISADYDWMLRAINNNANIHYSDTLVSYYSDGGRSDSEECIAEMYSISNKYMNHDNYDSKAIEEMRRFYFDVICWRIFERVIKLKDNIEDPSKLTFLNRSEKDYFIWGCGNYGKLFKAFFEHYGIKVKGFYDSNSSFHGTKYEGIPISEYSPSSNSVVIISVQSAEDKIGEYLSSYGLKQEEDYYSFSYIKKHVLELLISDTNAGKKVMDAMNITKDEALQLI